MIRLKNIQRFECQLRQLDDYVILVDVAQVTEKQVPDEKQRIPDDYHNLYSGSLLHARRSCALTEQQD